MRLVRASQLREGMILAKNITHNGKLLVSSNHVLTPSIIKQLQMCTENVYVYEIDDSFEAISLSGHFTSEYIGHILSLIRGMTTDALNDKVSYSFAINFVRKFLLANRDSLHQLLVMEDKHPYTLSHSLNVAMYGVSLGLALNLSTNDLTDLLIGGMLHDVGKLKVSNNILDKPGALDKKEFKAITLHPIYGYREIKDLSYVSDNVKSIILQHHEKLDGSGYPYGLRGSEINYLARVITVCDIFDAVVNKRAYHKQRTLYSGSKILFEDADAGKIDRRLAKDLIDQLCIFKQGSQVYLSTGDVGYVLNNCKGLSPIIRTLQGQVLDLSSVKNIRIISA